MPDGDESRAQGPSAKDRRIRIFLSYGHDANEELVRRTKADRETRARFWFDKNEIKTGDDWRGSIGDGILKINRLMTFLPKHSTRDPVICLDELAISIAANGGNIQTVIVESKREVKPPPTSATSNASTCNKTPNDEGAWISPGHSTNECACSSAT
jgi:hypothetical protein